MDLHVAARKRVLKLLQQRGARGANTVEICERNVGGEEGTRRVRELREQGYPVQCRMLPTGYWLYWLDEQGAAAEQGQLFSSDAGQNARQRR